MPHVGAEHPGRFSNAVLGQILALMGSHLLEQRAALQVLVCCQSDMCMPQRSPHGILLNACPAGLLPLLIVSQAEYAQMLAAQQQAGQQYYDPNTGAPLQGE